MAEREHKKNICVKDFVATPVEDDIRLVDAGVAEGLAHALQVEANVVTAGSAGDTLQLNNVLIANLQSADVLFAWG